MSPPSPFSSRACAICCGYLNVGPIRTRNWGGTCLACMAIHNEDPEAIKALAESPDPQDRDVLLVVARIQAVREQRQREGAAP